MQVNSAMQTNATGSGATSSMGGTNDMFLQLLTAQLKSQSPLDPLDPTQFVGQLTQFNSLDQLMQIRSLLQQVSTALAGPSSSGGTAATQGGK